LKISRMLLAAGSAVTLAASGGSAASAAGTTAQISDVQHACAAAAPAGHAECLALVRTDVISQRGLLPDATPTGYGPRSLQAAYGLASAAAVAGHGETVAIVDAFDDPKAAADLAVYRAQYGLPACTVASGCFTKVSQAGGGSLPPPDTGWAEEISLDLDMVSAVCPNCHILLVEADDSADTSLGAAVNEAVKLGARFISNSYGGSETTSSSLNADYNHPGVAITASAGDSGYGMEFPAASPFVTAVGGTSLTRNSGVSRGWTEKVWGNGTSGAGGDGTGSGCSAAEQKPAWQADAGCSHRTVADVSAVADPGTGVAVYDSYQEPGWMIFGGTSVSSPIIAATFALGGRPSPGTYPASYPYAHPARLFDVTSGSDGGCGTYLCTARAGYDGPTGLGTPDGTAAFSRAGPTVRVTSPGNQASLKGTRIAPLTIKASDSSPGQRLKFTASGLPAGLRISSAGVIRGIPTARRLNHVTVTATDGTGASGTARFRWPVLSRGLVTSGLPGKCMAARHGGIAAGTPVQIARCSSARSRQWQLSDEPGNRAVVIELVKAVRRSGPEGGCVTVRHGHTASGSKVAGERCSNTRSQQWTIGRHGHLVGVKSGKCLTDPGAGPAGTQLEIAHCRPRHRQHWALP